MIPDDIKARFLHEYIKSSNLEAIRNEIAAGLRGPVGPPPDFRVHMIAALEAVAADIWEDGYAAAEWNAEEVCKCAAWNEDECGCGNYGNGHRIKRNPYKEAA